MSEEITPVVSHEKLIKCGEAAFMASAGWRLRGAWEFLDMEGKNRWIAIAQEVLLTAGFEVRRDITRG
jgi:hypothetical protein